MLSRVLGPFELGSQIKVKLFNYFMAGLVYESILVDDLPLRFGARFSTWPETPDTLPGCCGRALEGGVRDSQALLLFLGTNDRLGATKSRE